MIASWRMNVSNSGEKSHGRTKVINQIEKTGNEKRGTSVRLRPHRKYISKGLRANANCRWKYSYRYIYSCIGICNADTPLHSLQLSKKRKLCRQKPHPRARSLWLEDFHRYPMAAWKNIIAFTAFTVVWVAPEKFRSLPPLPPSVLPSFLPTLRFVPSSSTSSSLDNPG